MQTPVWIYLELEKADRLNGLEKWLATEKAFKTESLIYTISCCAAT